MTPHDAFRDGGVSECAHGLTQDGGGGLKMSPQPVSRVVSECHPVQSQVGPPTCAAIHARGACPILHSRPLASAAPERRA
eukprot:2685827-Prymnesium_polylepis.1